MSSSPYGAGLSSLPDILSRFNPPGVGIVFAIPTERHREVQIPAPSSLGSTQFPFPLAGRTSNDPAVPLLTLCCFSLQNALALRLWFLGHFEDKSVWRCSFSLCSMQAGRRRSLSAGAGAACFGASSSAMLLSEEDAGVLLLSAFWGCYLCGSAFSCYLRPSQIMLTLITRLCLPAPSNILANEVSAGMLANATRCVWALQNQ